MTATLASMKRELRVEEIAARLRACRAFADLTRQELSERIGVSVSSIERWERGARGTIGNRHKRMALLERVAEMCGIPPWWMLDDWSSPRTPDDASPVDQWRMRVEGRERSKISQILPKGTGVRWAHEISPEEKAELSAVIEELNSEINETESPRLLASYTTLLSELRTALVAARADQFDMRILKELVLRESPKLAKRTRSVDQLIPGLAEGEAAVITLYESGFRLAELARLMAKDYVYLTSVLVRAWRHVEEHRFESASAQQAWRAAFDDSGPFADPVLAEAWRRGALGDDEGDLSPDEDLEQDLDEILDQADGPDEAEPPSSGTQPADG